VSAPRVLVIGNNTLDQVFTTSQGLCRDGKVAATSLRHFAGGQAANVAHALAGLGLSVRYLGAFGDDGAGALVRASLESVGIDLGGCDTVRGCPTHTAAIVVDLHSRERSIVMYKDDRLRLSPGAVDPRHLDGVDLVYVDNHEPEAALAAALLARERGIPVLADLESTDPRGVRVVPHLTSLVAPAAVIRELAGHQEMDAALRGAQRRGPRTVVATDGARGAAAVHAGLPLHTVPAEPCGVVDTTGAGDAFHAGFAAAALRGLGFHQTLRLATRLAAAKCQEHGPRLSTATLAAWGAELGNVPPEDGPAFL
jgi:sugar/nucleoside kinase (ribokinase family)